MAFSKSFFTKLVLFLFRVLPKQYHFNQKGLHRNFNTAHATSYSLQKHSQNIPLEPLQISRKTNLIFNVEESLLKSSSTFPYFMLVAFEAGSLIRAFLLLILYPFLCLVSKELCFKVMVFVCFFGIKKENFRVGSSVLPKFFLEDVGVEGFEILSRVGKKVGVSDLPQVMVESFLRDYLNVDFVIGRDLKVFCGYYVGLMEDEKNKAIDHHMKEIFKNGNISKIVGLTHLNKAIHHHWFSCCNEIYMVNGDKLKWKVLPRNRYPKAIIFHDGRLGFRPTPLAMLSMFIWFPLGSILSIFRIFIAISLPFNLSVPILYFTGIKLKISKPNHLIINISPSVTINSSKPKGFLYVCNHRTLLDPLMLSFGLKKSLAAVTYSLSRMSEILSPIRTVRLTRNRAPDSRMMEKLLNQGDLVVCPEGTTCREPYLLRFSPLFAEISEQIVPVALNTHVTMFHGTTAGGLKWLDPFFFLMNPNPCYTVRFLDRVCGVKDDGEKSSNFEVANSVQSQLGMALGFECTKLTRKDKYLILAGNEGMVSAANTQHN